MDDKYIDEETFLFIYQNVCKHNDIQYTDGDIHNPDISGDNYKIIYMINKVVYDICILTNRYSFPIDLKYLVIDMVNDDFNMINNPGSSSSAEQGIKSMSEAGRSVTFGATDSWQAKYKALLDQQLQDRLNQINKFKLLYKVECPYGKN